MSVEITGFRVGVGGSKEVAKRQQCQTFEDAIRQAEGASRRGEIWGSLVTEYGPGRWKLIGWYDGRGGVFAGQDGDEPATAESLRRFTNSFY